MLPLLIYRSDGDWDDDDRKVYFTTEDKGNTNVDPNSDTSFNLYTSDYPYSGGPTEFDRNLGNHDGFRVVGRYIFAQRTDSDGTVALYISDQRRPFHKAMIPVPDDHQKYAALYVLHHAIVLYAACQWQQLLLTSDVHVCIVGYATCYSRVYTLQSRKLLLLILCMCLALNNE